MTYISGALRRLIEERVGYKGECCQVSVDISFYSHEVDRVIALKHQGENLAYLSQQY